MPYGIRKGGDKCAFEVYNTDDDSRAPGGCHETRADALAHQKALMRNVPEAAASSPELDPLPGEHFHSVAHTEGESTGMRTLTNLTWRTPPFSFHWQEATSAHGGQPQVWQVGLTERMLRDPLDESIIHAFGRFDLESEKGHEYARRLVAGFERFVSIGLDETPPKVDFVWPDHEDDKEDGKVEEGDDPGQMLKLLFEEPEQILIDGGCIGELTGVSVPAQADATIEPTPELVRLMEKAIESGEIDVSDFATLDEHECPDGQHWDEDLEDCVPDEKAEAKQMASGFGGKKAPPFTKKGEKPADDEEEEGDEEDKEDKRPPWLKKKKGAKSAGVIRVATSSSGVTVTRTTPRSGPTITTTAADVIQAITAAAYRIEIPDLPPAAWFDEPTDVDIPGAFCVTDEGRIYGILAPLHVNHRAFTQAGRRMTVPSRNVDYSRFLGGEALTDEGRLAGVGPVTMDCGHASRHRSNGDVGPAHYENACTVVGKIRVGETADGLPWVAGALEPGVTPDQVSRMLACRLSGDWQPLDGRAGWLELVAALLVPSPGFPMARTGPTLTQRDGALVASSVPVQYVHDGDDDALGQYNDPRGALLAAARDAGSDEWGARARRLANVPLPPSDFHPGHPDQKVHGHGKGGGGAPAKAKGATAKAPAKAKGTRKTGGSDIAGPGGKVAPGKQHVPAKVKGAKKQHPGYQTAKGVVPNDAKTWPGVKPPSGNPEPTSWEVRPSSKDSAWKHKRYDSGGQRAIVTGGNRYTLDQQSDLGGSWRSITKTTYPTVERAMAAGDDWIGQAPKTGGTWPD